jgi:hypothetical protein
MKTKKSMNDVFNFLTILTLADALNRVDEKTRQEYQKSIEGFNTPDELAYKELKLDAKAIRGDWEPDWENLSQNKWFPVFYWSPGVGFVFSYSGYDFGNADTYSGSRLCFPNKEQADHFGKQFIEIHRKYLTIFK